MARLTKVDEQGNILVNEEERLLSSKGFIDKDEMYKIMRHLAEKLAEYEDLEDQNLFAQLPCHVGDTIYNVYQKDSNKWGILPIKVSQIEITNKGMDIQGFSPEDFGKIVFLTRELAVQALEKMQHSIEKKKI